eukprot:2341826-Prorocentrum_lima.AAC.1
MQPLFPHATLQSLEHLVADAAPGNEVKAVLEGHPRTRRDWQWEVDLPFRQTLFDDGDIDLVTEAWVMVTNIEEGRPLVEASATPNTLEAAGAAGCR